MFIYWRCVDVTMIKDMCFSNLKKIRVVGCLTRRGVGSWELKRVGWVHRRNQLTRVCGVDKVCELHNPDERDAKLTVVKRVFDRLMFKKMNFHFSPIKLIHNSFILHTTKLKMLRILYFISNPFSIQFYTMDYNPFSSRLPRSYPIVVGLSFFLTHPLIVVQKFMSKEAAA
ncbi:hypothetical protein HanRHA438_Chr10g0474781 [Helianthus annuus]|nr:hypothetical protein HanIR_Chr10g0498171 [Helianthus annuus]KAJ0881483.1 hypothetical protein HanRHA438_Chr10g0474781 [Helianthus annuus]